MTAQRHRDQRRRLLKYGDPRLTDGGDIRPGSPPWGLTAPYAIMFLVGMLVGILACVLGHFA